MKILWHVLATCAPILYDLNVKDPSPETKFPIHLRVTFKRLPKTYYTPLQFDKKGL